jgi:hypothetical protein
MTQEAHVIPDPPLEPSNVVEWTPFSERPSSPGRWHPKLTGYRALVLALTCVFALLKAILTYHGKFIAPVTLEWVFNVLVFLA